MSPVKQKSVRILLFLFYFLSLLETSFSSSPQRSILSLSMIVPHIQQNPGGNKASACNALTGDSKLVFASTRTETATKRKEIQGRSPEKEIWKQEKEFWRRHKMGGSAWKNSPLWPVVPLDSGRAEWQCADIKRPLCWDSDKLWYCGPASYFFSVAGNQICCWRWNHISRGDTPYHISPQHLTIFLHSTTVQYQGELFLGGHSSTHCPFVGNCWCQRDDWWRWQLAIDWWQLWRHCHDGIAIMHYAGNDDIVSDDG